ncbi:RNase H domain-containing protein [Mycena venus]|uniref:RNase H domain-containing protein n=1 Tax=Mycena venus TaxID=2733690 RepID=A0A8H6X4J6_9AGAR|nr:RNase H domain-containing protein [Mycena venus]
MFASAVHPHLGWFIDAEDEEDTSCLPKYMRGMAWKENQPASYSRTAHYTEIDQPLPWPPPYEFQNTAAMQTISDHPDLFHNPQSVTAGLRDGCWPWMNTRHDNRYPETWDNSWAPPASDRERDFINGQRDIEIEKGRFSRNSGPDLLPGMYSTPILAVPKPHSDDLRLVSHQSSGPFAPNTMVDKVQTKGPRMDTMQQFIPTLLRFRHVHPNAELVAWKSDMAEAFRFTSVHKLVQIKQIATSNLPTRVEAASGKTNGPVQRNVDWCSTFGSCGSPRIWASVMGLVIWIAIFVKHLPDIFCYVDDTKYLPTKQAQLFFLWDFLGIRHKEKKQIHGASLPIIGFKIDPNTMTAKLPPDSKADLEKWVQEFIDTPSHRRTLQADITVYCDASLCLGMGLWIPELLRGFFSPVPGDPPANTIFFFEALCHIGATLDNQNTVDIFSSLCATPNYNDLLRTAVDDLIEPNVDVRVLHIKGEDNYIADAISRQHFDNAIERAPGLSKPTFRTSARSTKEYWSPVPYRAANAFEEPPYDVNYRYLVTISVRQSPLYHHPLPTTTSSSFPNCSGALLRLGELTMPDNPKLQNPRKYSKRASAVLQATSYEYWLPAHKADTTFEGSHILITDADALTAFHTYLNSRDHLHPLNPYLWILSNSKVPMRAWFMRKLRHLFPDTNIAGQSMRAGGTTTLAEDGTP